MPNCIRNTKAICPYYEKSNNTYIQCEGIIKNARTLEMFDTVQDLEIWMVRYCNTYSWNSCPHACIMNKVYEKKWEKENNLIRPFGPPSP